MLRFLLYISGLVVLLAANCQSTVGAPEVITDEETKPEAKINWRPIIHEQLEHESDPNFLRIVEHTTHPVLSELEINNSVARNGESCALPNGRGIPNLIREARKFLPIESLRNIIANAANDPEVLRVRELIRSQAIQAPLARLRASAEHQIMQDFACRQLNLQYDEYIEFIREFLNLNLNTPQTSKIPNRRPGIRGLLRDLSDALPRRLLRELYQRLVATDKDLATAVQRIRSTEFRTLVRSYRSRREYRDIRALLNGAGLPINNIQQLVATALGWGDTDLGAEATILNV